MLTSDLSWSKHIQDTCTKAKKILGVLYRRFYQHADERTLRQLYISIVRPHLEYAAPVWDPHLRKDCELLEHTQKFAFKICTKTWDKGYDDLIDMINLPPLANRRLHVKLCSLYKIVHDLLYFPPNIVVPKVTRSHTCTPYTLQQPFARTNSYFYSFVPRSISLWNALPEFVVRNTPFRLYHSYLWVHHFISSAIDCILCSWSPDPVPNIAHCPSLSDVTARVSFVCIATTFKLIVAMLPLLAS